jgi:SAM-dependent methyltransferase
LTAARDRIERERTFHDVHIREGHKTIATKEWWETPREWVRCAPRITLLTAVCTSLIAPLQRAGLLVIDCGDGEWVNQISEFAEVTGIDLTPLIIPRVGRQLWNTNQARVEVGDVHELRFATSAFDICFTNSVLRHPDQPIALPEICRVLTPGRKLISAEPNQSNHLRTSVKYTIIPSQRSRNLLNHVGAYDKNDTIRVGK